MARRKNQYGLTPQQEEFCQAVADAYGTDKKGILVAAYRKAYNCKSSAKEDWHYVRASELYNDSKIKVRIEQLEEEQRKLCTVSKEELISRNTKILRTDPLRLMKLDPTTGNYIAKRLNEIPVSIRMLVTPQVVHGRMVYVLDKKTAQQVLIDLCGYDAPKDINVKNTGNVNGELKIGFDDDDE
ncbi:MAG: hypothetical protein NC453_14270 [Muribaculum sp.]|nr:hypothetical protein [Muribaculum sp.]